MKKLFSLFIALLCVGIARSQNIGDHYQGGIVAYILELGDPGYIPGQTHGLIAAHDDQSTGIRWYTGYTTTGAFAEALGTGKANTDTIIAHQGAGKYAAKLCANLVLGGYRDWYLPSKDELNQLYLNRAAIGGFSSHIYWSSTEDSYNLVWCTYFSNGDQGENDGLSNSYHVRAVRAF